MITLPPNVPGTRLKRALCITEGDAAWWRPKLAGTPKRACEPGSVPPHRHTHPEAAWVVSATVDPQCLHLIASALISSLQYGHVPPWVGPGLPTADPQCLHRIASARISSLQKACRVADEPASHPAPPLLAPPSVCAPGHVPRL